MSKTWIGPYLEGLEDHSYILRRDGTYLHTAAEMPKEKYRAASFILDGVSESRLTIALRIVLPLIIGIDKESITTLTSGRVRYVRVNGSQCYLSDDEYTVLIYKLSQIFPAIESMADDLTLHESGVIVPAEVKSLVPSPYTQPPKPVGQNYYPLSDNLLVWFPVAVLLGRGAYKVWEGYPVLLDTQDPWLQSLAAEVEEKTEELRGEGWYAYTIDHPEAIYRDWIKAMIRELEPTARFHEDIFMLKRKLTNGWRELIAAHINDRSLYPSTLPYPGDSIVEDNGIRYRCLIIKGVPVPMGIDVSTEELTQAWAEGRLSTSHSSKANDYSTVLRPYFRNKVIPQVQNGRAVGGPLRTDAT